MKIIKSHAYSRKINGFPGQSRFLNPANAASPGAPISDDAVRRATAESGFTLTEIVVASVIMAFMVITLYGGISFGFSNITLARQHLRATQIALEKMEITRMYSWDQINSNGFVPTNFTAPYYPAISGSTTNGGLTYSGSTIISRVNRNVAYSNDMRQVTVTLNWTNRNTVQTLRMSTFLSQYGMQRYIY
jgi:prepilin-type N-terminal cleavage/methylation domain-containing protein